jgi:hypothetical protein
MWSELIASNGRALRSYDPERGSLSAFLGLLAREQLHRLQRQRRRRKAREAAATDRCGTGVASGTTTTRLMLDEFLARLDSDERRFVNAYLLGPHEGNEAFPLSCATIWQMKRRILLKFLRLFNWQ